MLFKTRYFSLAFFLIVSVSFAQRGIDGDRTVTAAGTIYNEYTTLTASASAGATSITVGASGLNANTRFGAGNNLAAGDLIMIIQMQGAHILGQPDIWGTPTISNPNDPTWGRVEAYNNCGRYEFAQVRSVPNATTINIDCSLQYSYTDSSAVQVIRVPRIETLTINAGGVLTGQTWNGSTGGVVALEVQHNTFINGTGTISASSIGFRGGALFTTSGRVSTTLYSCVSLDVGTNKGEGVAGYAADYDINGGRFCRGAPGNGGGGANVWNCGGGGGANAGSVPAWTGQGNPNATTGPWTNAWNLEGGGFATSTSSGGGRGGYSFGATNQNATTTGPGNTAWGGANRENRGGLGGRPLDYSTGRIFMGGGGGAGERDNSAATAGAPGGGIVYLMNYGTVSGGGTIVSNGGTAGNSGVDGAGGGGGGGTVLVNSRGTVSGIAIAVNGGSGGSQVVGGSVSESEGPGGGGGGGYIAVSVGAPTQTATGGVNGTTNSNSVSEFIHNGATSGGVGLTGQSITSDTINANNVSICSGQTATLTANLVGTIPATITWYSAASGGTVLGTGSTYTTPALFANTTYYVGFCPGTYTIPVTVTIVPGPTTLVNSQTICAGSTATLTASGATTYLWSTGASTNPITVSPAVTTSYTVTGTTAGCSSTAVALVTVSPTLVINVNSPNICAGATTSLTASGGTTYAWSTGESINSISVSPAATTSYTVTGTTGGCSGTAISTVTVTSLPTIVVNSPSICSGSSATLTAGGGTTYAWSTGESINPISVTPAGTTSYTVTGTTSGCSNTAVSMVTVTPSPVINVNSPTICAGASATLTAGGGATYLWSTTESTNPISVSPAITTTYTVTGTSGGCSATAVSTVTVTPLPGVFVNSPGICGGATATLTAGGGTTYVWSTGETINPISVSPAGTTSYTVTGTTSGCSATAVALVTVSPPPPVVVNSPTICAGTTATLTAGGATTYAWSTGASTNPISVSPASTTSYTVTGTTSGCSATAVALVTVTALPPVVVNSATICDGASATLTAGGATTYAWSTGSSLNPISVNPTATTSYTVTGTTGSCSNTAVSIVTVTPLPGIGVNSPGICDGATATLTATGGTTYAWSTGASTNPISVSPAVTTSYTVTGTTSGCSNTAVAIVTVTAAPTINVNSTAICEGASATLTATGGTTYDWSTGSTLNPITVNPIVTTSYTVTGTTSGCSATAVSIVTVTPLPVIGVNSPSICAGASATLTATGGTSYVWSTGSSLNPITESPLVTTSYTVTGTSGSCSNTAVSTVTVTPMSDATITFVPTVCNGAAPFNLTAAQAGGTWSGTGITNTVAGTFDPGTSGIGSFTITYTIAGTCGATDTAIVTVSDNLDATINDMGPVCLGGAAFNYTAANGGGTWSGAGITNAAAGTFTPSAAGVGTFIITYTIPGSCGNTDTTLITVNPNSNATIIQPPPFCISDPPTNLTPVTLGGMWLGTGITSSTLGTFNPSVSGPGSFIITYLIGGSCGSSDTVIVTVNLPPDPSVAAPAPACVGDAPFNLSAASSGGNWTGTGITSTTAGTFDPSNSGVGTFQVIYTIPGSCGAADTIMVTIDPLDNATITPQAPLCPGSAPVNFTAATTGGSWSGTGITNAVTGTFDPGAAGVGSHVITYSIPGPCGNIDTVMMVVTPPVTASITAIPPVCFNAAPFTLLASPAGGVWSGSGITNTATGAYDPSTTGGAGTYTITYSVSGACGDTTTSSIVVNAVPNPGITSNVNSGCEVLCVSFTETVSTICSSVVYDFGDGNTSTSSSPSNCYTSAGTYSVVITCTDGNGCTGSTTMTNMIDVYPNPVAEFTSTPSIAAVNAPITFTDVSTGGTNSFWNFGDPGSGNNTSTLTSDIHAYDAEGTFCVTLVSATTFGCTDTIIHCVTIANDASYNVPNVFTPNGDGVNDEFFIQTTSVKSLTCSVFDRWGLKLAEWNTVNGNWDGRTTTGNIAPDGVYYYIMRAVGTNDKEFEQQGFIQVLNK